MEERMISFYIDENNELNIKQIVNDYTNYILSIAKNMCMQKLEQEDIEEIISDVFLVIWKNRNRLKRNMPMRPYIAGVSKNVIRNRLRQNKSYLFVEIEENLKNDSDINEIIEFNEEFSVISKELEKFGEDEKIFVMFYCYNKKAKEISKITGLTELNIRTKLHRMRKKIKLILEERGYYYGK